MRQVPDKTLFTLYGLVGSGQLAHHLAHYFHLLHIPFVQWSRTSKVPLDQKLKDCSHVLILITDSQIESFIQTHQKALSSKILVHCSGATFTPLAIGVHPLMTFSRKLYDEQTYRRIHFVMDSLTHPFSTVMPRIPNTYSAIGPAQKAKYHALCVMAGNFSTLLWHVFFTYMKDHFGISKSQALIYLHQTFDNIAKLENSLTGPLQRRDQKTIDLNLQALEKDPQLYDIYKAFIALHHKQMRIEKAPKTKG